MSHKDRRQQLSRKYCNLFFSNINYLRQKRGLSFNELRNEMKLKDFRISIDCVPNFEGTRKASVKPSFSGASTIYLAAFCDFFGEEMPDLMSINYRERDEAAGVK